MADQQAFRDILARRATGVAVVTTHYDSRLHGLTINSFVPVSLAPPLVLVSVDRLTISHELISASGIFAVSILGWRQMFLADRFAGRGPMVSFSSEEAPYWVARTGAPILADCLAWLDCRVWAAYDGYDHTLFVGQVEAAGLGPDQEPLIFYNRRFRRLVTDHWPRAVGA